MAVADAALPVWTIRPNWREGITERLEWLTDVLDASDGSEQARAMRLSPRREFECVFNPHDEDRSYFELWLHRLAAAEFMVPLWHDRGRLSASRAAGSTGIAFDNTNREFVTGGLALILGEDAQTWEKVTVQAQTDAGITIPGPGLTKSWLKGATIYPLRRTRLADESQLQALTSRVGAASIVFELNQANDLADEGAWTGTIFETYPIIATKPNYSDTLTTDFIRVAYALDNDHGLRHLADDAGRAFTVQAHSWQMRGRAEHMAFRQMLYRLRGRSQAAWLPTFNQDVRLARAALAADSHIHVKKIGYAYTGGAVDGRNRILLAGSIPRVISGTGAPLAAAEERLNLSTPLGTALPVGTTGSFLAASRLNQDAVEILHHTDTDGMAECKATFRQFKNSRVAPAIISYPIPASVENSNICGVPETEDCLDIIPPAVFEGWFLKIRYNMYRNDGPLENSFQDTDPVNVVFAAENIGFTHSGNWIPTGPNSQEANPEGARPVSKHARYNGQPYTAWFNANEAYLETTYWNTSNDVVNTFNAWMAELAGTSREVYYQKQHSTTTIASNTQGFFSYAWWDQMPDGVNWGSFRKVAKADYVQEDGYVVDGAGNFPVPGLWPVDRIFRIYR